MEIVLSLFDKTGNMVRPWVDAGYICWCVDIQHEGIVECGGITFIGADISDWELPNGVTPAIVFAFPPCTDLAASGARWWKDKGLRSLSKGIGLVAKAHEIAVSSGAPWMIENPVGALSSHWRKPDAQFDPCDFAGYLPDPMQDAYTKRTCLWTGGGFNMPLPKPVFPYQGSKMHLIPPSDDRADMRSETPMGFAEAVYQANSRKAVATW